MALQNFARVRHSLEQRDASTHIALAKKARAARSSLDLESRKEALQDVQNELISLRRSSAELACAMKEVQKEEARAEKKRLSNVTSTTSKSSSSSHLKPYTGCRAAVLEKKILPSRLFTVPRPHCRSSEPGSVPDPGMTLIALLEDAKHASEPVGRQRRPSVCASEVSSSSNYSVRPEFKTGSQRLGVFVHSVHHVAKNPDIPVIVSRGTFLEFMGDAVINASSWAEAASNDEELNEKYAAAILGADERGATSLALHVVGPCSDTYASLESMISSSCRAVCEALPEAFNLQEIHLIAFTDDEARELSKALAHF